MNILDNIIEHLLGSPLQVSPLVMTLEGATKEDAVSYYKSCVCNTTCGGNFNSGDYCTCSGICGSNYQKSGRCSCVNSCGSSR